jgi:predicted RNase H-like HicB family nuclease
MRHYVAIIHQDSGSDVGISFPDFPGCVSAGSSVSEAMRNGAEALAGHIGLMVDEGLAVPEPTPFEEITVNPEHATGMPALIPAPAVSTKTVRVNITLGEDALREIDSFAEAKGYTRSGFLVQAARAMMRDEAA